MFSMAACAQQTPQDTPQVCATIKAKSSNGFVSAIPGPRALPVPHRAATPQGKRYCGDPGHHPPNAAALKGTIAAAGRMKSYSAAIRLAWRTLEADPHNRDIQIQLARLLSWDHQYGAATALYRKILREQPGDRDVLDSVAKVYLWSGRLSDSLRIEKILLAEEPSDPQYLLQVGRLEVRLHQNIAARKSLTALLNKHLLSREARLEIAQLDIREGKLEEAYSEYETLLGQNFQDPEALYGAAQIEYYRKHLHRALPFAANLVNERPNDYDALLLLARIERCLNERKAALALLDRASRLSHHNEEIEDLRKSIREESSVTIHTSTSYARETSGLSALPASPGTALPVRPVEDLNTYGAATRVGFAFLPESSSYFLSAFTPSNGPLGGIQGAVAPAEFLYGQTTQLSSNITLRGGLGLVRMGPGEFIDAGTPVRSLGLSPIGYAGATLRLSAKVKLSFTESLMAVTYTPASTRFGVRERRAEAGLDYHLDSRTQMEVSLFHNSDFSPVHEQSEITWAGKTLLQENGHDWGTGVQWTANRNLIRSERVSLTVGYAGLAFGYAAQTRGVYMGFFNPPFYQQHLLTTQLDGKLWGPLGYSLTTDAGAQQLGQREPLTAAERLGPGFTLHANQQLSATLSYLHYNFAQSLGSLKGNVVQFSTDYRF